MGSLRGVLPVSYPLSSPLNCCVFVLVCVAVCQVCFCYVPRDLLKGSNLSQETLGLHIKTSKNLSVNYRSNFGSNQCDALRI